MTGVIPESVVLRVRDEAPVDRGVQHLHQIESPGRRQRRVAEALVGRAPAFDRDRPRQQHRVAPVENYPDQLLATLNSLAPPTAASDPTVVLLTPGVYNSAYYEHSFLADKLGIELLH